MRPLCLDAIERAESSHDRFVRLEAIVSDWKCARFVRRHQKRTGCFRKVTHGTGGPIRCESVTHLLSYNSSSDRFVHGMASSTPPEDMLQQVRDNIPAGRTFVSGELRLFLPERT